MVEIDRKALQGLGLTDNEIEVYLTLLRIGSAPVSAIAEHSEIYRPYVYDTLKKLQEKGLVNYVVKEGKKYFRAVPPARLMDQLKEREHALQTALPALEAVMKLPKEEMHAELYKGRAVVKTIQRDVINTLIEKGGENLVMGVDEKRFMDAEPIAMKQFFNEMKRCNFRERVLVRWGDNYLPGKRETTMYRRIPRDFFNPTSTFIYGNKVALVIFGEPMHGLIVESELLSDAYRKQFNLLWRNAKPVRR